MDNFIPLEAIEIASPCSADWNAMRGDDRARFCGTCQKNVYNLSNMSRTQAQALVAEKEGKLCVQFYRRADGTVITDDCPIPLRPARNGARWVWRSAAAGIGALAAVCGGWLARGAEAKPSSAHTAVKKGKVSAKPAPVLAGGMRPMPSCPTPVQPKKVTVIRGNRSNKVGLAVATKGGARVIHAGGQPMMGSPAPTVVRGEMPAAVMGKPAPQPKTVQPPAGASGAAIMGDMAISSVPPKR